MDNTRQKISLTTEYLRKQISFSPEIALILGTGLGDLVNDLDTIIKIPYSEIPNFPLSTAPSHKGCLLFGKYSNKNILIMQGRFHFYEGISMAEIIFPIRVMKELGVKNLIITNVSGSLREELAPGDIVLIEDHLNFMGTNPLIGPNDSKYGPRFPSMNENYSSVLRQLAVNIADKEKITLKQGVYIGVTGPSMETKSECRAFSLWGADLVGMSTVPEVIAAVHSGISVLGISVVSNMSNLFHQDSHQQQEIETTAAKSYPQMKTLLKKIVEAI